MRITFRLSKELHNLMLLSLKDGQTPSSFIRETILSRLGSIDYSPSLQDVGEKKQEPQGAFNEAKFNIFWSKYPNKENPIESKIYFLSIKRGSFPKLNFILNQCLSSKSYKFPSSKDWLLKNLHNFL